MATTISKISIAAALLIFLILPRNTMAANYITVATIGSSPSMDKNQDPQKLVDQVIEFWKHELDQVLPGKPDLILLPEFCDMSLAGEKYLKVRKNQILDFFASVAKSSSCYLVFGMKREDSEGIWRNSCVVLDRNGNIAGIYDKNFPTISEMEEGIKASKKISLIKCDFGTIGIAICFDLNFGELLEQYAETKPGLILFSSMYHGGLAQSIWAYRCRSYFVGAIYKGTPSEIRNPMGEIVASSTNYYDFAIARINLDCRLVHLDYNRGKLTALKEKYGTGVTIYDPGKLGSVLVSSEDQNVPVEQMIKEFDIEILDDYLNRARDFRQRDGNIK